MIGNPAYTGTLVTAQVSGAALSNTTTPTSLLPAAAKYTIPANGIAYIGQKLKIRAWGAITTTTGTNNMTLSVYMGGSSLAASQALVALASLSGSTWMVEFDLTCQTLGASANFAFSGVAYGFTAVNAITMIPATTPTASSTFNSATANVLDFYGTWSTPSASDSITLTQFEVISDN
jgi:hypothetical protein